MFKFLIFFISFSFAEVTLKDGIEQLDNFSLEYFHDKEQKLNIKTIQNIKFDKNTSNKFTFGYLTGDIWFRLTLYNQSQNSNFFFYLTESFFNEVNFFEPYQEGWQKQSSGLSLFFKNGNKKDINPSFAFIVEPQTKKTFYI
jgi:hypothetical protein